jgi:hypothetical protein
LLVIFAALGSLRSTPKGTAPVLVPLTAPYPPPTSTIPALGPVPGTVTSSVLSVASLIPRTCGCAFQTQRVLDLHKCDSLYKPTNSLLNTNSRTTPIAYSSIKFAFNLCLLSFDNIDARELTRSSTGARWAKPPTGPPHQKACGAERSPDLRVASRHTGEEGRPITVKLVA